LFWSKIIIISEKYLLVRKTYDMNLNFLTFNNTFVIISFYFVNYTRGIFNGFSLLLHIYRNVKYLYLLVKKQTLRQFTAVQVLVIIL